MLGATPQDWARLQEYGLTEDLLLTKLASEFHVIVG